MTYLETLKNGQIPVKKPKNKKLTPYDKFIMKKRPELLSGAAKVALTTPKSYNDICILVEEVKRNRGVMADFSQASPITAQRLLDFLGGAIYALGGRLEKVRDSVYLVTPSGMEIVSVAAGEDSISATCVSAKRN